MAFLRKAGSLLGRSLSSGIRQSISMSSPSIFQAIRCMSTSKLFIGGLSYNTDDVSLKEAFDKYGEVVDVRVIVDRETGRSRGFGFVTFSSSEEASAAIQALDQQDLHGRTVRVNYATERPSGGGGFRGGGFGGGGGGYGGGSGGYGGGGYGGSGGYGGGGYGGGGGGYSGGGGGYGNSYGSGGGGYGGGSGGGGYGGGAETGDAQNLGVAGGDSGSFGDAADTSDNYADRRG